MSQILHKETICRVADTVGRSASQEKSSLISMCRRHRRLTKISAPTREEEAAGPYPPPPPPPPLTINGHHG